MTPKGLHPPKVQSAPLSPFAGFIPAGFPSPASDYMAEEIDLNKEFNPRPLSTFIIRVTGDSMVGSFIPPNAWLLVDRSVKPANNSIIVGVINGELTVKHFVKNTNGITLVPSNPKYKPLSITEEMDFSVWGTVTKIIIDPLKSAL